MTDAPLTETHRAMLKEIAGLKLEVKALKKALGTFIAWTAQSANSPIRVDEANRLINIIEQVED